MFMTVLSSRTRGVHTQSGLCFIAVHIAIHQEMLLHVLWLFCGVTESTFLELWFLRYQIWQVSTPVSYYAIITFDSGFWAKLSWQLCLFSMSKASRPIPGPIEPSIQCVPELFPEGSSSTETRLIISLHPLPWLRKCGALSHLPTTPTTPSALLSTRTSWYITSLLSVNSHQCSLWENTTVSFREHTWSSLHFMLCN